jgi:hypothetical protein
MKKHRLLLIASLPVAIAIILGVLAILPPRPSVMKVNFDRIENGMKVEEVAKILDMKLGNSLSDMAGGPLTLGINAPDGHATIEFSDGSVISKAWRDATILDKIRGWLRLD